MESVSRKPYYSYYGTGSLLFAAHSNSALPGEEDSDIFRQQTLDIYNLRSRDTPVMLKQEASGNIASISGAKRERQKPTARARTSYNKRLLVNARERERMKTLNKGFENLRNALPCYIADGHVSKITTLRLAINYIKTLTEVLKDTRNEGHSDEDYPIDQMAVVENLKTEAVIYENARSITQHYSGSSDIERSTTTTGIDRAFKSIFEKNTFLKPSKIEH